jgi:FkbM family methyltransferase
MKKPGTTPSSQTANGFQAEMRVDSDVSADRPMLRPAYRFAGGVLRAALSRLPVGVRDDAFRLACDYASPAYKHRMGLSSLEGALDLVRRNGFQPATIVDVGAYIGNWALIAHEFFPGAQIVMIDGNPQNDEALCSAVKKIGTQAKHFIALLGSERRMKVKLFQNATGTSVLKEFTSYKTAQVEVPMFTLDGLLTGESLVGPLLLKLDVQGFELEVLRGGTRVLAESELVLLEVSTLPFNEGAPLFAEVIHFMSDHDFEVFDFCGQARRHSDEALFQIDVLFANRSSRLRRRRKFFYNETSEGSDTP